MFPIDVELVLIIWENIQQKTLFFLFYFPHIIIMCQFTSCRCLGYSCHSLTSLLTSRRKKRKRQIMCILINKLISGIHFIFILTFTGSPMRIVCIRYSRNLKNYIRFSIKQNTNTNIYRTMEKRIIENYYSDSLS